MKQLHDFRQGLERVKAQLSVPISESWGMESTRGLAHSKTWRNDYCLGSRDSVLECGRPLPLLLKRLDLRATFNRPPSGLSF